MPELPEVETIMLGITPFLEGATITKVKLNRSDLRWPFPEDFAKRLEKAKVLNLKRRSKYILVNLSTGETLLIHLGMSGKILVSNKKNSEIAQILGLSKRTVENQLYRALKIIKKILKEKI